MGDTPAGDAGVDRRGGPMRFATVAAIVRGATIATGRRAVNGEGGPMRVRVRASGMVRLLVLCGLIAELTVTPGVRACV